MGSEAAWWGGEAKWGLKGDEGSSLGNRGTLAPGGQEEPAERSIFAGWCWGQRHTFWASTSRGTTEKRGAPSSHKPSATTKLAAPYLNALC